MISEQERAQLRTLVTMPQWKTLERFAELVKADVRASMCSTPEEWPSTRAFLHGEGRVAGITMLFQRLQEEAQKPYESP